MVIGDIDSEARFELNYIKPMFRFYVNSNQRGFLTYYLFYQKIQNTA